MKDYHRPTDFSDFGTPNNPEDQRTNYRFYDKYIPGYDESPEELFRQVTHEYINDRDELETIKEILVRNGWDNEAEVVQFYIDELDEEKQYGIGYNVSRMKIDLADGYTHTGFEQYPYGDDMFLTVWQDRDNLIIQVEDYSNGGYGSGGPLVRQGP